MPTACHSRHAVRFHPTPAALALAAALFSMQAQAAPTGGQVTAGTASIQQNGAVTDIHQASQKAAINWQGFGIAPHEAVNFHQPNASAITLNRVVGNEASLIQGALNANGRVFLVNANGILFTQGASVNTAGLVASTLNITDQDFLNGNFVFQGDGSGKGSILNLGTIKTTDGGYVALLGDQVRNQGVIVAQLGTVALSSGKRITLNFNGDSLLKVSLDEGTLNALVENGQAIRADGGKVILTAKAANGLLDAQVNNTGIVQAQSIGDLKGDIHVYAHGGTANIDGTLDASAPNGGDGGFIETSGDTVKVADSVRITTRAANGKTGTWLIDPTDFTIGQGGDITGATLSAQLENNSVTIESVRGKNEGNGDIHVNDAVAWSADTLLTLDAVQDININNAITINGANAGLILKYGGDYHIRTKASYAGTELNDKGIPVAKQDTSGGVYGSVTFTNAATRSVYTPATPEEKEKRTGLFINEVAYTLVHSMDDLAAISGVQGSYALAKDLTSTQHYDKSVVARLNGTLAGLGHSVDALTITTTNAATVGVGLIGNSSTNAMLRDIGITNASIVGTTNVGTLLGSGEGTLTVKNAYSNGAVNASGNNASAGGLIGTIAGNQTNKSMVSSSFSTANVSGTGPANFLGGLFGTANNASIVRNSHATGNISGTLGHAGGLGGALIGAYGNRAIAESSYASGTITKTTTTERSYTAGGLFGFINYASVQNVFATGDVTSGHHVGGLIGTAQNADIRGAHATGNVTSYSAMASGNENAATGGLIGYSNKNDISDSFATGNVTSTFDNPGARGIGGLLGVHNIGDITRTYATGNVTASQSSSRVGGLIGMVWEGHVINSYAKGAVSGGDYVGGLVGMLFYPTGAGSSYTPDVAFVTDSQAYGNVSGNNYVGGLVGMASGFSIGESGSQISIGGNIGNSTAYGNVTGTGSYVGGVAGWGADIDASQAYGSVIGGGDFVGGIAGRGSRISNSFFGGDSLSGAGPNTGLVAGSAWLVSNNYYTRPANSTALSVAHMETTSMNDSRELTGDQVKDLQYYLDGTIDQVLADRAAEAERAEAERAEAERIATEQAEAARLAEERATAQRLAAAQLRDRIDAATQAAGQQRDTARQLTAFKPDFRLAASLAENKPIAIDQHIIRTADRSFSADVQHINVDGATYEVQQDASGRQ